MTIYNKKPHIFIIQGIKTYLWFEREKIPGLEPMIDIRMRWEFDDEYPYHEINFRLAQNELLVPIQEGFDSTFQMIRYYVRWLLQQTSRVIEKQKLFQYD